MCVLGGRCFVHPICKLTRAAQNHNPQQHKYYSEVVLKTQHYDQCELLSVNVASIKEYIINGEGPEDGIKECGGMWGETKTMNMIYLCIFVVIFRMLVEVWKCEWWCVSLGAGLALVSADGWRYNWKVSFWVLRRESELAIPKEGRGRVFSVIIEF